MRVAGGERIKALLAAVRKAPVDEGMYMDDQELDGYSGRFEGWSSTVVAAGHNLAASAVDRDFAPMLLRTGASAAVEQIEFSDYNATILIKCAEQPYNPHAHTCRLCARQQPGASRGVVVHILRDLLGSGIKWPRLRSIAIGPIVGRAGVFSNRYVYCTCALQLRYLQVKKALPACKRFFFMPTLFIFAITPNSLTLARLHRLPCSQKNASACR